MIDPQIALALLIDGALCFAFACGIVCLVVWMFRVPPGRWQLALWSLPLCKLMWVLAAGPSHQSYLRAHVQAFGRDSGFLTVGVGVSPPVGVHLHVLTELLVAGRNYRLSAGDAIARALFVLAPWMPLLLLAVVGVGVVANLARLCRGWTAHRQLLGRHWESASVWKRVELGFRTVDIRLVPDCHFGTTPFTGGVLRPYVALPEDAFGRLDPAQQQAIVLHELAHVLHWDVVVRWVADLAVAVFWFVPAIRWVRKRALEACEASADQHAVGKGATATALASAVVQHALWAKAAAPTGLVRLDGTPTMRRLRALLDGGAGKARLGWNRWWVRWLVLCVAAQSVLVSSLFGPR